MNTFVIIVFIITALLMIGFVVGMFFLIRFFIRKGTKEKSPQEAYHQQQQMLARVDHMKKSLDPWGYRNYRDISSWMTYKFSKGMSSRLVGTVYGTDQKPILAFSRLESGFNSDGYFFVGSTKFDIACKVRDQNIEILYNNQPLGTITSNGDLIDASGNRIGHAAHPTKISINSGSLRYRFGESTFDVVMHNKKLAVVHVAPNYADFAHGSFSHNFNENAMGQPILTMLESPSTEEEKWLLAIAIIEITHHGHWMI